MLMPMTGISTGSGLNPSISTRSDQVFPRLTNSMVGNGIAPPGVHRVSYQIDLSVADPFLCDPAVHTALEERLCL